MTFDLFGDPEPEAPAPKPVQNRTAAEGVVMSPARAAFEASRTERELRPCLMPRPARTDTGHPYRCRVGGGSAAFSDNMGHSHFCMTHRPWGFLISERDGF